MVSFCKTVDAIVAPSLYVQRLLSNYIQLPVVKIPSGLLSDFVRSCIGKQRCPKKIKLLLVSRMVKEKNIACVLHVAQMLCAKGISFELKLIGYGVEYDALRQYAYDSIKLPADTVLFIHKPSKQVISQAYHEADLFLFPSQTDTQGLVLAEAMAHGTPVIAFDGPGQRDIIQQGINGFIVNNAQEMCNYIEALSKDHGLLTTLERGAYQTAQAYLPTAIAGQVSALYRQLIGTKQIV